MAKINFRKLLFTANLCLLTGIFLLAQEKDNKKFYIKVKKNDTTTVDTSFTIDEDMDKDEIQKMIYELTGMDVMVHNGESHSYIYKHDSGDNMKWVDHKSGNHLVFVEEEDGKKKKSELIVVCEEGEGDEKKVIKKVIKKVTHKDGDMIMITEEDIHKDDKENVFIMGKEIDDKKVIILESSEKPIHFTTKDGKELEFIVKDKKSGTDIALDRVKVIRIETTGDGNIEIIVSDKKEKVVKKSKVNKKKLKID